MLDVDEHTPQKTIVRFYMFSIFYPKTLWTKWIGMSSFRDLRPSWIELCLQSTSGWYSSCWRWTTPFTCQCWRALLFGRGSFEVFCKSYTYKTYFSFHSFTSIGTWHGWLVSCPSFQNGGTRSLGPDGSVGSTHLEVGRHVPWSSTKKRWVEYFYGASTPVIQDFLILSFSQGIWGFKHFHNFTSIILYRIGWTFGRCEVGTLRSQLDAYGRSLGRPMAAVERGWYGQGFTT